MPFVDAIEDITGGSAKLARSEYREAGRLPVVDQGKRLISGYTDDPRYLFKFEGQHIIFGDHTRA
ncbi:restriction endonuclease subunit S, partial [Escherichia coli]|nr:restriction endonuclease subunit S [Escherichia coli]